MQVKKIFLASSEELKDDRRSFELDANGDEIIAHPDAADVRSSLELNGSPRLR